MYPGNELYTIAEVIDKKEIKEEFGIITVLLTTYNDKEEKVFKGELSALIRR
ncbi:hypothetical protein [Oceanobacillus sp. CFH 90083]|uniref:hypothetical protein n=1 Tax=Oceanobacillus sp. CFH 90083 TaxID=2592336 RepID=UPI001883A81F